MSRAPGVGQSDDSSYSRLEELVQLCLFRLDYTTSCIILNTQLPFFVTVRIEFTRPITVVCHSTDWVHTPNYCCLSQYGLSPRSITVVCHSTDWVQTPNYCCLSQYGLSPHAQLLFFVTVRIEFTRPITVLCHSTDWVQTPNYCSLSQYELSPRSITVVCHSTDWNPICWCYKMYSPLSLRINGPWKAIQNIKVLFFLCGWLYVSSNFAPMRSNLWISHAILAVFCMYYTKWIMDIACHLSSILYVLHKVDWQ